MNCTDLRYLKTEEKIQNSLLELLKEKELKAITIKEICDRAKISRNAFYQHYGYKEDVYNQMIKIVVTEIENATTPLIPDSTGMNRDTNNLYAEQIINGVIRVKPILQTMLINDDGATLRQLTDILYKRNMEIILSFYGIKKCTDAIELYVSYYSAGIAEIIIRWVKMPGNDRETVVKILSEQMWRNGSELPKSLME